MDSKLRCLVWSMMWWALMLFVLAVGSVAWGGSEMGTAELWASLWPSVRLSLWLAAGGFYGIAWAFCLWNALLSLTNSARAFYAYLYAEHRMGM